MERLEELMAKRKWRAHSLRTNVAHDNLIEYQGKVKIAKVCSASLNQRNKEPVLYDAIKECAPEWCEGETRIILNKDLTCKRHKDGNEGHSWILWLGDFTGGALIFDDGRKVEEKSVWHKIHGQVHHWNEPHEGTKYAIVLYRSDKTKRPKTNYLQDARRRIKLAKQTSAPGVVEQRAV